MLIDVSKGHCVFILTDQRPVTSLSFETSVSFYQYTRRNITEDLKLYQHRCENLICRKLDQPYITISAVFPTAPSSFLTWRPTHSLQAQRLLSHLITLRRTTVGRTPLNEWSTRRTVLYLKTHVRNPCSWRDSNPQSQQASGHWVWLRHFLSSLKLTAVPNCQNL